MKKEIKIVPPEGYEIDEEKSTFDCIKLKPIQNKRWRNDTSKQVVGFFITQDSNIAAFTQQNIKDAYNLFSTEKQAKSALAMARISQIMANDERFGGVITDEEWENEDEPKFIILRNGGHIEKTYLCYINYYFLAFHTEEQRELFLEENEDLVRDYLMID